MNFINNLIESRILLSQICDGFSNNSSKDCTLSAKTKVLYLLENKDLSPAELIRGLCIAKSNLANLLKSLVKEDLIISYKNSENHKNIYYRINDKGLTELKKYKETLKTNLTDVLKNEELFTNLENTIKIIKGIYND